MQFSYNLSKISVELYIVDVRLHCFGKSNWVAYVATGAEWCAGGGWWEFAWKVVQWF